VTKPRLTLLGTAECKLCHEMADVVRGAVGDAVELVAADVRSDPEWHRLYRYEIPVLLWDGREVARHRVSEAELQERLRQLGLVV
jgi:hypothetical protein